MNRGQIRDKARVIIDEYGTEDRWDNDDLNHLLDLSYKKVASIFLGLDDSFYTSPGTFSLSATVEKYALPAGFLRIKSIVNDLQEPLTRLYNTAMRQNYYTASGGRPEVYYLEGNQIGFLNVPDTAYSFPYVIVKAPADLTDDNSIPDVPAFLGHELIAAETAKKALSQDEETSPELEDEIKELRKQIVEVYHRRNSDFSRHIEDDPALEDI